MAGTSPPRNLEELLDRFDQAADHGPRVSLDTIMDAVGRRSFGPLLLLAGVIMAAPVIGDIPGVPTILGVLVLLVAVQLLAGREHFWLPQWLLNRSISSETLRKATRRWLRKPARGIDRLLRKRIGGLTRRAGMRAMAIACVGLALLTPVTELVPFSANGVGAGLVAFGLALIAHDGAMAVAGFVISALCVGGVIYGVM